MFITRHAEWTAVNCVRLDLMLEVHVFFERYRNENGDLDPKSENTIFARITASFSLENYSVELPVNPAVCILSIHTNQLPGPRNV